MEGDERKETRLGRDRRSITIKVDLDSDAERNINTRYDLAILRMIEDAKESDEPLRLLETRIWDPETKIAEFDIPDSDVLKIMYRRL